MEIRLQKISKWQVSPSGNISVSGPMSPMATARQIVEHFFADAPQVVMTDLFRLFFSDEGFTTWKDADIYPVDLDVLVAVLNFKYFIVFTEYGAEIMPILLILDREKPQFSPNYEKASLIARPTNEELVNAVLSIDTAQLKADYNNAVLMQKNDMAEDWFMELSVEDANQVCNQPDYLKTVEYWSSLKSEQKYELYERNRFSHGNHDA